MPIPTDRGYVTIDDMADGSKRVEIYARRSASGRPTHLFATHTGCPRVVVESNAAFQRIGTSTHSTEPVEVSWDESSGLLYIRDPARIEELPECRRSR
jgi:hypothetical protein